MDTEMLLKNIIDKYNLKYTLKSCKISSLEQYPHIFKIEFSNFKLIGKIINKARMYCDNINHLYSDLSNIDCIEVPILTKDGNYYFTINDKVILIYEELQEIKKNPSPIWWATSLGSIHNTCISNNYKCYFSKNFFEQALDILLEAQKYIPYDKKNNIDNLLNSINASIEIPNLDLTLCHNDPYNLNVMLSKGNYKLIDTDGVGLSPKEYDIQKLLYNFAISSNDFCEIFEFWNSFKTNYEKITFKKINIELLKKIYVFDFIRSMSWLYIVSNDISRLDKNRQLEQLNLYEKSLDNDIHLKILKKIK